MPATRTLGQGAAAQVVLRAALALTMVWLAVELSPAAAADVFSHQHDCIRGSQLFRQYQAACNPAIHTDECAVASVACAASEACDACTLHAWVAEVEAAQSGGGASGATNETINALCAQAIPILAAQFAACPGGAVSILGHVPTNSSGDLQHSVNFVWPRGGCIFSSVEEECIETRSTDAAIPRCIVDASTAINGGDALVRSETPYIDCTAALRTEVCPAAVDACRADATCIQCLVSEWPRWEPLATHELPSSLSNPPPPTAPTESPTVTLAPTPTPSDAPTNAPTAAPAAQALLRHECIARDLAFREYLTACATPRWASPSALECQEQSLLCGADPECDFCTSAVLEIDDSTPTAVLDAIGAACINAFVLVHARFVACGNSELGNWGDRTPLWWPLTEQDWADRLNPSVPCSPAQCLLSGTCSSDCLMTTSQSVVPETCLRAPSAYGSFAQCVATNRSSACGAAFSTCIGSPSCLSCLGTHEMADALDFASRTGSPTVQPSLAVQPVEPPSTRPPTKSPTTEPTDGPTHEPTFDPSPTASPLTAPTAPPPAHTTHSSSAPPVTTPPTSMPSVGSTSSPAFLPTALSPTAMPHNVSHHSTSAPHEQGTRGPAPAPTTAPPSHSSTTTPTGGPTELPTRSPVAAPFTDMPTPPPSDGLTFTPTKSPVGSPTASPTRAPTVQPADTQATTIPTALTMTPRTAEPTHRPTRVPTAAPSATPTQAPSATPSSAPTMKPSATPSTTPSRHPSVRPTAKPSAVSMPPTMAPRLCNGVADPISCVTIGPLRCHDGDVSARCPAHCGTCPTTVPTAAPTASRGTVASSGSRSSEAATHLVVATTLTVVLLAALMAVYAVMASRRRGSPTGGNERGIVSPFDADVDAGSTGLSGTPHTTALGNDVLQGWQWAGGDHGSAQSDQAGNVDDDFHCRGNSLYDVLDRQRETMLAHWRHVGGHPADSNASSLNGAPREPSAAPGLASAAEPAEGPM